jgi:hypothetical protein
MGTENQPPPHLHYPNVWQVFMQLAEACHDSLDEKNRRLVTLALAIGHRYPSASDPFDGLRDEHQPRIHGTYTYRVLCPLSVIVAPIRATVMPILRESSAEPRCSPAWQRTGLRRAWLDREWHIQRMSNATQ